MTYCENLSSPDQSLKTTFVDCYESDSSNAAYKSQEN